MNTLLNRWLVVPIATAAFLAGSSLLLAEDPPKKVEDSKTGKELKDTASGAKTADQTFDGRKVEPTTKVEKSTQTVTAAQISKQENQKEQQRQKEVSQKAALDKPNAVPAVSSSPK